MKAAFEKAEVEYPLVPPHTHIHNTAEHAISTFKNHFITGLYLCDTWHPAREWNRLILHAQPTLNLLGS